MLNASIRSLAVALILLSLVGHQADGRHGLFRRSNGPQISCAPALNVVEVESSQPPAPKQKKQVDTLEGRFIFAGVVPKWQPVPVGGNNERVAGLLIQAQQKGLLDPVVVDPKNKGLSNVVVFLRLPKGGVWPIAESDKIRKETLFLDAPLIAFNPRVVALYPEWFDGKNRGETGQKSVMKNSSPVPLVRRATGHPKFNPGFNRALHPGSQFEFTLSPQPLAVVIQDDIHTWSKGFAFVFDHPYFAITKADGTFTIPRIPAGMEVEVRAWHETKGVLFTKTLKFVKGKNVLADVDVLQFPDK